MMLQIEDRRELSACTDAYGMPVGYISSINRDGTSSVRVAQDALRSGDVVFPDGVSTTIMVVVVYSTRLQTWLLVGEHPSKVGYDGGHIPSEGRYMMWRSTCKLHSCYLSVRHPRQESAPLPP